MFVHSPFSFLPYLSSSLPFPSSSPPSPLTSSRHPPSSSPSLILPFLSVPYPFPLALSSFPSHILFYHSFSPIPPHSSLSSIHPVSFHSILPFFILLSPCILPLPFLPLFPFYPTSPPLSLLHVSHFPHSSSPPLSPHSPWRRTNTLGSPSSLHRLCNHTCFG